MRLGWTILIVLAATLAGCHHGGRSEPTSRPTPDVEVVEQHWPDRTVRLRKEVIRNLEGELVNHGTYTRWYDNGRKEYECTFIRGQKHGITTMWHRNGRKWTETHHVHGKRHGLSTTWDTAGRKRREESYADDRPHGTWTVWQEDGRIKWRTTFDHGTPGS